jgi:hypothetical protein
MNTAAPQAIFHLRTHSDVRCEALESTKERPLHGVWQDKGAVSAPRGASAQPAALTPSTSGAVQMEQTGVRSQNRSTDSGTLEKATIRIPADLKAELQRIAKQGLGTGELSFSAVVTLFLYRQVQGHLDMQYGAMLGPLIEHVIDKRMQARDNRLVALLVRIAFETGQIRGIVTNNLAIQPGITAENIQTVLTESEKEAKANITRRSPQLAHILEELKAWITEEEGTTP